ncbi:conserved hypothetical protein [Arcobacter nitrofigilis DSM 7299]|uniref:Uncharacterized protein TP-0789 domain-containing protein n=1 Tax=Arcobacter nitrofigilis (strain ATCC 33309 / DSM 7299 / CCUG 15893 / LMG 7604 / NCTC 12251 / CI) TaxID=572480 RepID=D5V0Q8_ARCNC|nr:outer membrane lipoprotein-sorting protein [Arcobacter nitrofigilis]ADG93870.1 conserved hypothetical protein [Arcobacter nitrofigilis DSM 7299]
MIKKITIVSLFISQVFALTPFEIAINVKKNSDGYGSSKSVLEMILLDQAKNKSKRIMESISFENKNHYGINGDKSLMEFKTPLDVKGTKFLTHEKINKNNNQWLYLPVLKRIKRITSKNKSGSFMGSEFSYEDISSREPSKYTYSTSTEDTKIGNIDVYKYERYPKDKNSGYSKQILFVDKTKFVILKVEFFDKKNELLKTAKYTYRKIKNIYRVAKIQMNNHQNLKSTTLTYVKDDIKLNLDEKLFSKRYLKD